MRKLLTVAFALAVLAVLTVTAGVQMNAHNDTPEALVAPVVLPDPAVASQGWSVAIEQNAMLTNCGSTKNIPVAGASDCTTAKTAAWNLLTTLLSTPNCMNSGCPKGYAIAQGVSSCKPDPYTRPNGSPAMRWQVGWTWTCVAPACCNYRLDLSTGQGGPQDAIWKVNGKPAYVTPPYPGWIPPLAPAKWIQPVANPTPSSNVGAGHYKYTTTFTIPDCPAANEVRLDGKFSADNSATVLLDNQQVASCPPGNTCFKGSVALSVSISPGPHTLTVDVLNEGGPSGLMVNAQLTRRCR
jgi:hypothetical protein